MNFLRNSLTVLSFFLLTISCNQPLDNSENSAIIPVAREGKAYERFLMLNEKVQNNRGEIDLLFVGDSITERWETDGRKVWEKFYGNRKALNIGIGADRTQHVLWRLENGNINGLQPKATIVLIGTNNSHEDRNTTSEMHDGVVAVVNKLLKELPSTEILLLGIFPRGRTFNLQRGKITQANQVLQFLDQHERIHYLDIGHYFLDSDGSIPEEVMPDALHLSEKGYEIWATSMEPILSEIID